MLPKRDRNVTVELRKIPMDERFERTSKKSFEERGNLLEDFTYWYLTNNEFPYEERKNQMILWSKSKREDEKVDHHAVWKEFSDLLHKYTTEWYSVTMNALEDQSVPARLHFHIYKISWI